MAILYCLVPSFLLAQLARDDPDIIQQPVVLLDDEERVLALSSPARRAGVKVGQTARQAHITCPELQIQNADLNRGRHEFEALLTLLDDYSDAVEPGGLGGAYLDAPDLNRQTAIPFCQDIGRRLRQELGVALQPAIGCDQGKFTASAAARHTRPGAVRVILGAAEQPFLRPLTIRLLPLSPPQQRLLTYLGIHTLGQFAEMPTAAVFQQFGAPGRLAQQWARGRDKRPVIPRQKALVLSCQVDFDPPVPALPMLTPVLEQALIPLCNQLRDQLQAAQALNTILHFDNGQDRVHTWHFSQPTTHVGWVLDHMTAQIQAHIWPAPVSGVECIFRDIQEATGDQLSLFPGTGAPVDHLKEHLAPLRLRYGPARLLRADVPDPLRLRVEYRIHWHEYVSEQSFERTAVA